MYFVLGVREVSIEVFIVRLTNIDDLVDQLCRAISVRRLCLRYVSRFYVILALNNNT